jgi:hypothetical protein
MQKNKLSLNLERRNSIEKKSRLPFSKESYWQYAIDYLNPFVYPWGLPVVVFTLLNLARSCG